MISDNGKYPRQKPYFCRTMLDILYKDNQCIAVNKPVGVPVQPDKTGDATLQSMVEAYCHHPVLSAHRLDRPVSGITLFAKNKRALTSLQQQFQAQTIEKGYLAVLQEKPAEAEGRLVHYLKKKEATNTVTALTEPKPGAEEAVLWYRYLGSTERYHFVYVRLLTGRHHQIRAQLAAIGCPIKGDVKYGARRGNPDRSIHLHAWRLAFQHPISGTKIQLEASLPPDDALWQALAGLIDF